MKERSSAPILIVGAGRSGTTLMRNVLAAHGSIFAVPRETGYFSYLHAIKKRFDPLDEGDWRSKLAAFIEYGATHRFSIRTDHDPSPARADSQPVPISSHIPHKDYGGAFRDVLDRLSHEDSKTRWTEKSPHHVFHADSILRALPDALFIEMVRDPRDVIASRKSIRDQIWTTDRYSPETRERKSLERSYDPLWDSLKCRQALRAGERAAIRWPEQWLRVRYEDLVQEPGPALKTICSFLDLGYEDSMLVEVPHGITGDVAMRGSSAGIKSVSVGRWRSTLSDAEVASCQYVCRGQMYKLGYEPVVAGSGSIRAGASILGRSAWDLVRRLRRQHKLGGASMVADATRQRIKMIRSARLRRVSR